MYLPPQFPTKTNREDDPPGSELVLSLLIRREGLATALQTLYLKTARSQDRKSAYRASSEGLDKSTLFYSFY